jgi:two-component system, sensor histidine kinase LadS
MVNYVAFVFLLLFLCAPDPLPAQTVVLSDDDAGEFEITTMSYLKDKTRLLSLKDVIGSNGFAQTNAINFGFDDAAHWFSFEIGNHSGTSEWLLEVPFAPLDQIELFYPSANGWLQKVSGDIYPVSSRDVRHPYPVFVLDIDQGETIRCYVRIQSTSSIQFPARLWSRHSFYQHYFNVQIVNGVFYGALVIMILYQLFLFFSTRERISLYYVFTLLAMMHVVSFFQGYSFLYLYPAHPQLNHYMAILTAPVFLIFSTWLTRAFLDLPANNPPLDKLLLINLGFDLMAALLMLVFWGSFSYRFHHYAILVHSLLALVAASYSIYRRFRPALFYFLSWLTLLVCALVFSLTNLGVSEQYLVTNSTWLIIGCIIQMLLISFAIGNRWNMVNKEHQLLREHELSRRQEEKENLENEVRLRTEEIQTQNERLEEVNRIKDKLFSVVSHDIKGPLTSMQLALGLIKRKTISKEEFQELAVILETRFNQTTAFIENLLQWASIQMKGIKFDPVVLSPAEIARNTVALLDFEMKNKNITVTNLIDEAVTVVADVNMVNSIMRNLLMNAIKFTPKDGSIRMCLEQKDGTVTISIADTGVGIPEANRAKLFSMGTVTTQGTRQEKGTGLGLLLCKEFVERNGGKIWFESEERKGTTFYFTLPSL